MGVREEAIAEAEELTDRQLRRAFAKARESRVEYLAIGDLLQVEFATLFLNVCLDEAITRRFVKWLDRHPDPSMWHPVRSRR